jgi:guanyl-specific ribonuclease Sa
MWDLTVSDVHTFAVGEGQWVVHNDSCPDWITPGSLASDEEARLLETVGHIDAGTVPGGDAAIKWDTPFRNREGNLPGASGPGSPYREYRVDPGSHVTGPGTTRLVRNPSEGTMYYTWTHYGKTGSPPFVRIR